MSRRELFLVPVPAGIERLPGSLTVTPGLAEALERYNLAAELPPRVRAVVDPASGLPPQGYILTVEGEGARVLAADRPGLFYALMTLRQLVRGADRQGDAGRRPGRRPCLRIEDRPAYPVRGVLLDVSRDRVPTMDTLRRQIDLWAELKLNQVQLYMEHTFAYPSHPLVWREASPFTPAEVEELDLYCAERAIELVPCQNSFGHMERWLRLPGYRHLAECPGGFTDPWGQFREHPSTLNPLDPGSLELLAGLYDELLPHFASLALDVGGDEPWELGQGKSRDACRERGRGRVYLDFLLRIRDLAQRRGRAMQFYGDIVVNHPALIRELPRDLIALEWGYEGDHPFERECGLFAEAGVPFYVCPGTSSWNSIGGRWTNARENIHKAAAEGRRTGAAGLLLTDWGDHGHWQQYPVAVPPVFYGAAAAWSPDTAESLDVAGCLSRHFFHDPTGEAARALLTLAGLYDDGVARFHNAGVLAVLLLPALQPYYRRELSRYGGYPFSRELEGLEEAGRSLGRSRIGGEDGGRLGEEIAFTAALMAHAAKLGRARFATPDLTVAGVPQAVRRSLAGELEGLIERYQALWLARSRPGGLRESAGRMRDLLATYRS